MSKLTKRVKILNKVYTEFQSIENGKDLKKNKLTLADYDVLFEILKKISNFKECSGVWCMQENVANWCKKQGMYVIPPKRSGKYDSVNYWINIIEN